MSQERLKETKVISDWYELNRLNCNVWAIREPFHDEDVFSYLVKGIDIDVLIDTGMGVVPIPDVLREIRNKSKPLVVLNTHAHFDHIGGNKYFPYVLAPRDEWEKTKIRSGWTHKEMEAFGIEKGFLGTVSGFDIKTFTIPPYKKISPILTDGAVINLGERILKIIGTPGHTPGSVCILDSVTGELYTSDTIYDGPLYAYLEESDFEKYFESIVRLNKLVDDGLVRRIHPGHNYSDSPVDLIKWTQKLFENAKKGNGGRDAGNGIVEYSSPESKRLKLLVSV